MNWRDYTTLTAIVFVMVVVGAVAFGLPVAELTDWRPATILLTILALFIFFAISPMVASTSKPGSIAAALLGMLAVILAFTGIVINNRLVFVSLCVNLVALWALTIYYHVQSHESRRIHQ